MRLCLCPNLAGPSAFCDIRASGIADARWIAFLTLEIALRTDGSILSVSVWGKRFPPPLWFPLHRSFGCLVIREEIARCKGDREEKTEQGQRQNHGFKSQIPAAIENSVINGKEGRLMEMERACKAYIQNRTKSADSAFQSQKIADKHQFSRNLFCNKSA